MKGIVPSLNTPFSKKGDLDLISLSKLVTHTINSGCSGMLGLAVAGEHEFLSFSEKTEFIKIVSHINKEKIPFIVSVSSFDNDISIKLSKIAKKNNAKGICIQIDKDFNFSENIKLLNEIARVGPEIIMIQDLDWYGKGLSQDFIIELFDKIEKFKWLKIETTNSGLKYTKIKKITNNKLNVCGGWAVTQLIDALNRGVDAFIPTGLEFLYVTIYNMFKNGNIVEARNLFNDILPIINFSNQNINLSIKFFKNTRVKEKIFKSNLCRNKEAKMDLFQKKEATEMFKLIKRLNKRYMNT